MTHRRQSHTNTDGDRQIHKYRSTEDRRHRKPGINLHRHRTEYAKFGNSNLNNQRTEDTGSRKFKPKLALGEMSTRGNACISFLIETLMYHW